MTAPDFIWLGSLRTSGGETFGICGVGRHEAGGTEFVRRDPAVLAELPEVKAEVRKALEGAAPWAKLGVAVMEGWPDGFGDIDGFQMQDMAEASGVLVAVPGGFNPEEHDDNGESEPGDPYFFIIKRPALISAEPKDATE
jgi:hypothetical protein